MYIHMHMLAYAHMHVIHEKLMKPKQLQMEKLKTDMRQIYHYRMWNYILVSENIVLI